MPKKKTSKKSTKGKTSKKKSNENKVSSVVCPGLPGIASPLPKVKDVE